MDREDEHPARLASQRSMAAVEAGDREAWLDLFAADAVVEDPVGPSIFDPDGHGHRGREAIAAFWDKAISQGRVSFDIRDSYAGGDEVANVGRITTTLPDGTRALVDGVYVYRVNDDGDLISLRAFWEMDRTVMLGPDDS